MQISLICIYFSIKNDNYNDCDGHSHILKKESVLLFKTFSKVREEGLQISKHIYGLPVL